MHPLLRRQLQKHFGAGPVGGSKLEVFLGAVDDAYRASDEDRALIDHTLKLASQESVDRYNALQRDIAKRQMVEQELDTFFLVSRDVLAVISSERQLALVSPSWTRILGHATEGSMGRPLLDFVVPEDQESVAAALTRAATSATEDFSLDCRLMAVDGQTHWFSWNCHRDGVSGRLFAAGRDVTQRRLLEQELSQSQKLEAVGSLASGIAHEINTPVQYVGDNLSFIQESLTEIMPVLEALNEACAVPGEPISAAVAAALAEGLKRMELDFLRSELVTATVAAVDGVRQVAELVKALKEFAHTDNGEPSPADLNRAIERTVTVANNQVKYAADVVLHLGVIPEVDCHIGALNQVFLNLIVNAAHAIEDRARKEPGAPRGTITVTTTQVGPSVVVAIQDTGCGIPEGIRGRIFDPFFTTKEVGRGTGQGLPIARGIVVDRHHGHLDFATEVGRGTTFFVRLPISASAELASAAA